MELKTKIIATIGPATWNKEVLEQMYKNGFRVARVNSNFADYNELKKVKELIHSVSKDIVMVLDTIGYKIRLDKKNYERTLVKDQTVKITSKPEVRDEFSETLLLDYKNFEKDIENNHLIYLDDGMLQLKTVEKNNDYVQAVVVQGGVLKPGKTVNLPDTILTFPPLTQKDEINIKNAIDLEYDYINLSFARRLDDISIVRQLIGNKKIGIIVKIENPEGVSNMEELIKNSDGVMVPRGDLGVEMPLEQLPILQKQMTRLAYYYAKPVIIATQMLESMRTNLRPTRAEISDVANAVFDQADLLMLSAETSTGEYPAQSVKVMSDIAKEIQKNLEIDTPPVINIKNLELKNTLSESILPLVKKLNVEIIVYAIEQSVKSFTNYAEFCKYTFTLREISKMRANVPILALVPDINTARQVNILYNVTPIITNIEGINNTTIDYFVNQITKSVTNYVLFKDGFIQFKK